MASKKKAAAAKKTVSRREGTITEMVQPLILEGKFTTEQLVEKVKAKFPDSAFKATHVNWHRQHLKALGKKVPDVVRPERAESAKPKVAAVKKVSKKRTKAEHHAAL